MGLQPSNKKMITQNFIIEKKEKSEFKPLPENIYQVELFDVNVETRPTYDTRTKPENERVFEKVLKFQFVLLNGKDGNEDLRGRSVWENFVPTYLYIGKKGKNTLYQIIESLIARELTQEEEATFTSTKINELIGMQCRVGIKNKATKEGNIFSNIETYYKKESDLTPLTNEEKEKSMPKEKESEEPQIATEEEEIPLPEMN